MLEAGIKGTKEIMVTNENTAKTMGSGTLDVFATPAMIALMENTAGMETAGTNLPTLYDHMFDADDATRTDVHSPYVKHHEYNKEAGKQTGFQKGKHELFPFPTLETSINPNIVQNPGW